MHAHQLLCICYLHVIHRIRMHVVSGRTNQYNRVQISLHQQPRSSCSLQVCTLLANHFTSSLNECHFVQQELRTLSEFFSPVFLTHFWIFCGFLLDKLRVFVDLISYARRSRFCSFYAVRMSLAVESSSVLGSYTRFDCGEL